MIEYVMIHHSLTADNQTVSWQAIRNFHKGLGWRDIGYHYGIERVNFRMETLVGRPEDQVAAACKEARMNKRAIHVCCVGNFDSLTPSEAVLEQLVPLVAGLVRRYKLSLDHVVGHRDFATYKSCPGKMFNLVELRQRVLRAL